MTRTTLKQGRPNGSGLKEWTPAELRALRRLKSPAGIQAFLDEIPYHIGNTSWSPRTVLKERTAHCLEGAIFAAAALEAIGHPPLILDLEAEQDTDHVICVYRAHGAWGAIAASNYSGCRGRAAVHRTLRELALSYFQDYFNHRRERSMRRFSRPVDLRRFDALQWRTKPGNIWFIAEHLCDIPHTELLTARMRRGLTRVDERTYRAGLFGRRE